jgi:hypothetical protein
MRNAVKWATLTAGTLILLYCGGWFIAMARSLQPFGISPFTWSFLTTNPKWLVLPPLGLVLLATGLVLFVRGAERD